MYFKCTKGFYSIAYAPRSQRAVSSLCPEKEHANSQVLAPIVPSASRSDSGARRAK